MSIKSYISTVSRYSNRLLIYIIAFAVVFTAVRCSDAAQSEEQIKLNNSAKFGDFSKSVKHKKTGKVDLVVWEPFRKRMEKHGLDRYVISTAKLAVDSDEVWERKAVASSVDKNKKSYITANSIVRIYWKGGKTQALVVLKEFVSDPLTGQKLQKPEYNITDIQSRDQVFKDGLPASAAVIKN